MNFYNNLQLDESVLADMVEDKTISSDDAAEARILINKLYLPQQQVIVYLISSHSCVFSWS